MATAALTLMRRSLWDAVDNWPAFADVFKQKWRFEDVGAMGVKRPQPSQGKLPAFGIFPATANSDWVTNQEQEIVYAVNLSIFTDRVDVLRGELLWQEMVRCIWQSAPAGTTQSYVLAACHDILTAAGPTVIEVVEDREILEWRWQVTLKRHWNPRLDTDTLTIPA